MSNQHSLPQEKTVFDMSIIVEAISKELSQDDFRVAKTHKKNYHKYIRIMAELGWPAYMDGDYNFHERIVSLCKNGTQDLILNAIYEHYDALYIQYLQESLEESKVICKNRIPLFKEAFLLYNLGYYYGSVTLLLTQLAGIIKDIDCYLSEMGLEYDEDSFKLLNTRYKVSKNGEKGKILLTLLEGRKYNDEDNEYLYLIGYFRSLLFAEKLDNDCLTTQINRNMIFHGEQVTFGSKEQALKLILCIDSLLWVCEVLYKRYN